MVKYLMDASAWIEYFKGSEKGKEIRKKIKNGDLIITTNSTIGEIYNWCHKQGHSFSEAIQIINAESKIHDVSLNLWIEGANYNKKIRNKNNKFGIIDGILVATQKISDSTILTTDNNFRGLKNVQII